VLKTTDFNPRARKERDGLTTLLIKARYDISIHAPVKSATTVKIKLTQFNKYFNPRARKERDRGIG